MGTDGLWDNLFTTEVVSLVENILKKYKEQQKKLNPDSKSRSNSSSILDAINSINIAQKLAQAAHEAAGDEQNFSPFAKSATDKGYSFKGGKMDDITIIFAYITLQNNTTNNKENSSSSKTNTNKSSIDNSTSSSSGVRSKL